MKKIWTDFNEPEPSKMRLSKYDIEFFELKGGDRVIFYDEDFQIEAIIRYDEEKKVLFGEFDSEFTYVSADVAEARQDGFLNGECFGKMIMKDEIIRSMKKYGIPIELIMEITNTKEDDLKGL